MKRSFFCLIFILIATVVYSQENTDTNTSDYRTITIIPGKNYEANWLHELFFGEHWRDLWTEPVEVKVLDLDDYAGGLTAIRKGGGLQTKSLRLKDKNGKEYKFRSVDKDPSQVLALRSPELEGTVADHILQDQISSGNPYAPLVVYHFTQALKIHQWPTKYFYMPDHPNLGKFTEFKNMFGMLEQVPDDGDFPGSDDVKGTIKMLDDMNEEHDVYVDANEYLKARLLDIFINDWDRHKDQWRWVKYKRGGDEVYVPYPQDRDQAFSKLDGIIPGMATSYAPQLNHFSEDYPDMVFQTWTGRILDQRFLNMMDRRSWDSVTNFVFNTLTDGLIEEAVRQLPYKQYLVAKEEMLRKLKSRRDLLRIASREYYEFVNRVADITTTDKDDYVEIFTGEDKVTVNIYKRKDSEDEIKKKEEQIKKSGQEKKDDENKEGENKKSKGKEVKINREHTFLRSKTFDPSLTEEIRLHLQEEDDLVIIRGGYTPTDIIIVGGDGKDEVSNSSNNKVYFHDSGKKSKVAGNIDHIDREYKLPHDSLAAVYKKIKNTLSEDDQDKYEEAIGNLRYDPSFIDRGHLVYSNPLIKYNSNYGFLLGFGIDWTKYAFRTEPYKSFNSANVGYVPNRKGREGIWLNFNGIYNDVVFRRIGFTVDLLKSGIEVNNFFGFGNETPFNELQYENDYHRVDFHTYRADILGSFPRDTKFKSHFGIRYENQKVENVPGRFVDSLKPVGSEETYNLIKPKIGFSFDSRDHQSAPYRGLFFQVMGEANPSVFKGTGPFQKVIGDFRTYFYFKTFTEASLAFRLKGEKVWGNYPFYEAAFLGGINSLRGYPSERFAGDASVYGGAELRFKLFEMSIIVPEDIWLFGFAENGRVFYGENDSSKKWHPSYGGGIYMQVISRNITLALTFATSPERKSNIYFNTGFTF